MSERFWLLESAEEKRVQGYTGRPAHMEKEGWTILAELPKSFANERPDDLDIATIKDEQGFEQVTVTLNEQRKGERLAAEQTKAQEREQKEAAKLARKQAAATKALSWQNLSGKEKDDLLRAVVEQVLGIDLAEDVAAPKDEKEKP